MQTYGMDFKSALNYVQQRRFCVQPNDGFEQQLKEFEPIYRALLENQTAARPDQTNKRDRDEDSDIDDGDIDVGVKLRVKDNVDIAMEQH